MQIVFTCFKLHSLYSKMVMYQVKFDLMQPKSSYDILILKFDGSIEEYGRFDDLSIFKRGDIDVKMKWIFSIWIDTEW